MHRYKQIIYRMGAVIEMIRCVPRGCRKGVARGPKKTKKEIEEANLRQAARRLSRKINANFKPGDLHVTLTYKKDARPAPEEAYKIIRDFLGDLRKEYKKHGFELKYIHATEYERKAIHHHLIVNWVNDGKGTTRDYIRSFWKGRGNPKYVDLYDSGEYQALADYLIKETEKTFRKSPEKQRYSCSRNLIIPKPEKHIRKTKKGWRKDPRPLKGYYIVKDSLYNGFDKLGYPYQRYVMVKLDTQEKDWNPRGRIPRAEEGEEEDHV